MESTEDQLSGVVTRGREQPSLEYGPQRIHYIHSTALPQAYLTLFSILQGLAFGILLIGFPLPKTLAMPTLWNFALQQYFYLPYLFSLGLLIVIWIFLVNASLIGGWPHNFLQVGLVVLLTLSEILAFRAISTLTLWLTFIGCGFIVGGIILIRSALLENNDDYDPSPPFQEMADETTKWERRHGLFYIFVGIGLIALASGYVWIMPSLKGHTAILVTIVPWTILLLLVILLCVVIKDATDDAEAIKDLLKDTDLTMSRHGVLRYVKKSNKQALPVAQTLCKNSPQDSEVQKNNPSYHFLEFALAVSAAVIVIFGYLHKHKKQK